MTTQEEIDLRKKEKKIDRNHWMCRIQKYAFDIDAPTFYMGYCPFFWMTWVALIALPFVFLFKGATIPGVWIWDKCTAPIITHQTVSREKINNTPLQPSAEQLVNIASCFKKDSSIETHDDLSFYNNAQRIFLWIKANPDWRDTYLVEAERYLREMDDLERLRYEAKKARTAKLRKVNVLASMCGATIFKFLIPLFIVSLGGGAIFGCAKLAIKLSLQDYAGLGVLICGAAALILFGKILFRALTIYFDNRKLKNPNTEFWVIRVIEWCLNKLVDTAGFLQETVPMTYKQECPLIIWGEETGPIEKRKK